MLSRLCLSLCFDFKVLDLLLTMLSEPPNLLSGFGLFIFVSLTSIICYCDLLCSVSTLFSDTYSHFHTCLFYWFFSSLPSSQTDFIVEYYFNYLIILFRRWEYIFVISLGRTCPLSWPRLWLVKAQQWNSAG